MKIDFSIGDRTFQIEPYRTYQEKDILLSSSFGIKDLDRILEIINFNESGLTENEKKVILYKAREISLGNEIDIKFKCKECGQGNDGIIDASNFVIDGSRNDDYIRKLNENVTDENLIKFVEYSQEELDDLDIQDYEELKKKVTENQIQFNFTKSCKCLRCQTENIFDLSSPEYIIEIMSEDNLMTLYKSYNLLIYFGHYTKTDIDNMYPFERNIFIGLFNKTKEDLSKQ
jgi:hypothetical protein